MGQEINEAGVLQVTINKNVVFRKKYIRNIFIDADDNCVITIVKKADEGELIETIQIPSNIYLNEIEPVIMDVLEKGE